MPKKSTRAEYIARFYSRVDQSVIGCHEYRGGFFNDGYGSFWFEGTDWRAPRFAWFIVHGPIPDGMLVCHRCDNPPCVRLDHLFLGTVADNTRDMIRKGRKPIYTGEAWHERWKVDRRGDRSGSAKLTWPEVRAIRAAAASGERYRSIAARFGIGIANTSSIVRGHTWQE
jgi:hypothetical protein